MKIFIEVLKKIVVNNHIDYIVKTQIEKITLSEAKKALNKITISTDEKKRIHYCYHDEHPPKPCEII